MSGRWPLVVGGLAMLGGACRDPKESPKPAPPLADPSGSARSGVISAPAAPSLPATPDAAAPIPTLPTDAATATGSAVTPPLVAFEAQTRDPAWAPKTEKTIKQRFAKVRGGKLEATECRESACQLTISGSEGDIGQTIADLESPRGMHGFAKTIILTAPEKKPDGTIVLRAVAVFER